MVSPRVTALRSPQLDGSSEDLDLPGRGLDTSSGDLSCDSRANSDYEDTDGGYTDGEGSGPQDADEEPPVPALARSSEPAWVEDHEELRGHGGITAEFEPQVGTAPRSGTLLCAWSPPTPSAHASGSRPFSSLQAGSRHPQGQWREDSMR